MLSYKSDSKYELAGKKAVNNNQENSIKEELLPLDLKRLEYLLSITKNFGGMNFEEVDAFLTANLCAQQAIPPEQYLPLFLGDPGERLLSEELRELSFLILSFHLSKKHSISSGFFILTPILRPDDKGQITGKKWANAFIFCLNLTKDIEKLRDDSMHKSLLPLLSLAQEEYPAPESENSFTPIAPEVRDSCLELLPVAVSAIYDYLKVCLPGKRHKKQGPNEPCPCGSGKKFKHCCKHFK